MKKILILFIILVSPLYLTGCWDQKIYEQLGFVLSVGMELSEDNKLLLSYTLPVVDLDATDKIEIVSSTETLLRSFRNTSRKISSKTSEGGKIQHIYVSDSLAKYGIHNLLELFERDPRLPLTPNILILEGSPKEMFEASKQFGDKPRLAFYVNQLIENNIATSTVPETRIYNFNSIYFSPGIDPIATTIKLQHEKGTGLEITGSALFSGDKLVGKIDTKQTSLLLAMMGKMKKSSYISSSIGSSEEQNGKSGVAVSFKNPKRNLSVKFKDSVPIVNISLSFKSILEEYKWDSVHDEKSKKSIEKLLSKEIEKECMRVLNYTQEVGSDPLGIGDIVGAKYNQYWKEESWKDEYANVKFNIKVKVNIINHGGIN
jgi:spore germination protein